MRLSDSAGFVLRYFKEVIGLVFLEIAAHKLYDVDLGNLTGAAFNGEELYDSNWP